MNNGTLPEKDPAPIQVKTEPKREKKEAVAYIGPNMPEAKQYTVFNNGLPAALQEMVKQHPVFRSLVIPVGRLSQACAELSAPGSALNILYKKAEKIRSEEG